MNCLNTLYEELDFESGSLYSVTNTPASATQNIEWLEKGEWLAAAKQAGADKIFFVQNNPVIVFAECGPTLEEKVRAFNRMWCLARPRLLFLASSGEITVYDLAKKPVDENDKDDWKNLESLQVVKNINAVSRKLQKYHRDHVESGRLFADKKFGDLTNRADNTLIRDLKTVRRELVHAGLSGNNVRFAHAIIGRSIFIRYLEDRGILTEAYFFNVARENPEWTKRLHNPPEKKGIDFSANKTFYPRILPDKKFTYALFRSLARDFNGDMFPDVDEEEHAITPEHLELIQDLLYGDVGKQKKLFFYSYNFGIIPLDLISSIYEEFYHIPPEKIDDEENIKRRQDGAFYTPPVLVEFILSRVLTPQVLERSPRVLDPACGSGIFLVEAFRRIVRHEWYKKKSRLTFDDLKRIIREQIAGIEVNEEAARITAFSLYLSMLQYLDPPAVFQQIKMGNKLPNLIASVENSPGNFQCILPGNAFDTDFINSALPWKQRFGKGCADVVVGNPPWGAPGTNADEETKKRHRKLTGWCNDNNKPIGDKEPSQAFLWLALDFLKKGGKSGMLVSAGVLLKHHETSREFRRRWLDAVRLNEVFNFSHVRTIYFKGAISPFIAIRFEKEKQTDAPVYYWSAKKNLTVKKNQTLLLSKNDLRILRDYDLSDHRTWKIFMWGTHKDYEFLNYLEYFPKTVPLKEKALFSRVGFKKGNQSKKTESWLSALKFLKNKAFSRYEKLGDDAFQKVPGKIECHGKEENYRGQRIIVKEAPHQRENLNGQIVARYETADYACNHSFHIIKLAEDSEWQYSVTIGILWSSLARYFLFLTTHFWGLWRDKVLINERLELPVIFDRTNPATQKIISLAGKLHDHAPLERNVLQPGGIPAEVTKEQRRSWEKELDEAVFELYGLNDEQVDLIRDLCEVTLPFYYRHLNSGGASRLIGKGNFSWIENYVHTFCRRWNVYLEDDAEMRAEVHLGAHGTMVAVDFFPADKDDPWDLEPKKGNWAYILEQVGDALPVPMGTSQIVMDGLVHVVSDNGMIIIKRNEKRFWTRSLAREDADAAIAKRMLQTKPGNGRKR